MELRRGLLERRRPDPGRHAPGHGPGPQTGGEAGPQAQQRWPQGKDYARKKGESTPLLAEWYNKKDISVGRYCPANDELFSPELVDTLVDGYNFLEPYYQYFKSFCKAGLEDMK